MLSAIQKQREILIAIGATFSAIGSWLMDQFGALLPRICRRSRVTALGQLSNELEICVAKILDHHPNSFFFSLCVSLSCSTSYSPASVKGITANFRLIFRSLQLRLRFHVSFSKKRAQTAAQ